MNLPPILQNYHPKPISSEKPLDRQNEGSSSAKSFNVLNDLDKFLNVITSNNSAPGIKIQREQEKVESPNQNFADSNDVAKSMVWLNPILGKRRKNNEEDQQPENKVQKLN